MKKIPLLPALFGILIFYIPFQVRYYKPLRDLALRWVNVSPSLPHYFDKSLGFYLTDIIMIGIIGLCIKKWRPPTRLQLPLFLFLGVSFISVSLSKNGAYPWPYASWLQFVLPILVSIGLAGRIDPKQSLRIFSWILLGTSLFQCLIGFSEYMLQHTTGLKALGEQNIHSDYSAYFDMPNRTRWIFDSIFHTFTESHRILRITGTLPHANILGGFMAVALIATSWLFLEFPRWRKWIGAALFLQVFTLFLTYSRAALFAWMAASLLFLLIQRRFYPVRALAGILVLSTLLSGGILYEQLFNRGGIVSYNAHAGNADRARLTYQDMAIDMAKERPWFGVGWGHYVIHLDEVIPENKPVDFHLQKVHNIYFLLLAESGILGLSCFLLFVGMLLWEHRRFSKESGPLLAILTILLAIGLCDHYVITTPHGRLLFFISAGLLAGQSYELRERKSRADLAAQPLR